MFIFFSNRFGCGGSLLVSAVAMIRLDALALLLADGAIEPETRVIARVGLRAQPSG